MSETEDKKREKRHQEDLERLRSFRPIDDTFMRGLFKDNLPDYYREKGSDTVKV